MASSSVSLSTPGLNALDALQRGLAKAPSKLSTTQAKAKAASQDFEAVFVNTMFQQMFSGIQGEGPMGGKGAAGVWRSFLTDEYAKNFVKAGGIGIADQVYKTLLARQEVASS